MAAQLQLCTPKLQHCKALQDSTVGPAPTRQGFSSHCQATQVCQTAGGKANLPKFQHCKRSPLAAKQGCKTIDLARLQNCAQGCNTARLCKTAAPANLKFQNFKSFQDIAQAKLPNYRPGKASLLNCRRCRPWLQNRLGRASAPTLQGFAKLQPLPTCQSTAHAKVPNYRPGKGCRPSSNTARLSKQVC